MKNFINKKFVTYVVILAAVLFSQAGCQYGGIVSVLGTPSYEEQKIPAEYDITKQMDNKILVFVDQPEWLSSQTNLRYFLTKAIRQDFMLRLKLKPENLITYEKLVEFRDSRPDFSSLSPAEVGKAMDANMVLLVLIEDYQLRELSESGYLAGSLNTRAILYDANTGMKLWPQNDVSKSIKVGYELETHGAEVATFRLVAASAYCTTRYLYDCPKPKFKVAEDRTREGSETWESWK